jgi:hypothetical protein
MNVVELAPGLWRWTAPHPDWSEGEGWEQDVGCVYYEAGSATVLIDPLVPDERELFCAALDRDLERRRLPVTILLTCAWHARSRDELTERYGADDSAPAGVQAFAMPEVDEVVWWLPEHRALVAGDLLLGSADGVRVCPDSWIEEPATPESVRAAMQPLLELPVEQVLVSHGDPVLEDGRDALARALS